MNISNKRRFRIVEHYNAPRSVSRECSDLRNDDKKNTKSTGEKITNALSPTSFPPILARTPCCMRNGKQKP